MARILIIGGGPAGSVFASRMAMLGHDVTLLERARFPRPHLGESLSPGVLPLLDAVGARRAVMAAGFAPVRDINVDWEAGPQVRHDPHGRGLLVDRGRFDAILLDNARAHGVRVIQPALVRHHRQTATGVAVDVDCDGVPHTLTGDFIADARGRGTVSATRQRSANPVVALYAYWRGRNLPTTPTIAAGSSGWFWGVPLPDGSYNTLAFIDPREARGAAAGALTARFHALLAQSSLLAGCRDAVMTGPVQAIDATPYRDPAVTMTSIRLGDAALAIDPISSSGVQKAIQNALAGAIVVNTILRRPNDADAAMAFFRASVDDAATRHSRWAAEHYGTVARTRPGRFWQARATPPAVPAPPDPIRFDARALATMRVGRSPAVEFIALPCLDDEFVAIKPALRHPHLDGPLAFLGGRAVAPLLAQLPSGLTPMELARAWSPAQPVDAALSSIVWLLERGVLEPQAAMAS